MAKSVGAIHQGFSYQAIFFWLQACRLLDTHSAVEFAAYEAGGIRHFDDVVVKYKHPVPDAVSSEILTDYFQVKYHTNQAGTLTYQCLMDPRFMGTKSTTSLLQRLQALQKRLRADPCSFRAFLIVPWGVDPHNPLAHLVGNQCGELRLEKLAKGGPRSVMGKVRTEWRRHLELPNDDALFQVLRPLRLWFAAKNLESLNQRLNERLIAVGLKPVDDSQRIHPYEALVNELQKAGRTQFTCDELLQECKREGLWCGRPLQEETTIQVGVRSFIRWAEYMEDETDHMLCLTRYFDNRTIRHPGLWNEVISPKLSDFLSNTFREQRPYHLHLDTHSSIAFAAGYFLDPKAGVDVITVQRGSGKHPWRPALDGTSLEDLWWQDEICCNPAGTDVALAISVTHGILPDVKAYVESRLSAVGRIIAFSVLPKTGPTAVRGATHALNLAHEVSRLVKQGRTEEERQGGLHIFMAAPNALSFFIGQLARSFGPCTLYEYDFESNRVGAYEPSLTFPPQSLQSTSFASEQEKQGGTSNVLCRLSQ